MLQKLGKELGEEKIYPHKFRRILATKAIDKGMLIEQVQHLLNYTKIDTTLHYTFVMLKYLIENIFVNIQKNI